METVRKLVILLFFTAVIIVSAEAGYLWGLKNSTSASKASPNTKTGTETAFTTFLTSFSPNSNRSLFITAEYAGFVSEIDHNATAEGTLQNTFRITIVDNDGNDVIATSLSKQKTEKSEITTLIYGQEVPGSFTEIKKGDKALLILKYDVLSPKRSYTVPAYSKLFYISPAK